MSQATDCRRKHRQFEQMIAVGEQRAAAGDLNGALALAQGAAYFGFRARTCFASPRLERLLARIGRQLPAVPVAATAGPDRRRVLHVLTHARPVGGDSRFAWRWIQLDGESRHSVVLTNQQAVHGMFEVPSILDAAVRQSGGTIHELSAPDSDLLGRAVQLRRLCQQAEVVVLHLFPYDVLPVVALAAGCEAVRTAFINHADHTFWVGGAASDLVVHLRRQSPAFLRQRRGLNPDASALLPIPLPAERTLIPRAEARRQLGLPADAVILLTIAGPFKFQAPEQTGFLDLVLPVLARTPAAVLLAIGPDDSGAWHAASEATGGRVIALGARYDTDVYYAAADVYLDSVPFSSITSLLEAGSSGLPLLGLRHLPQLELLGAGAPGLDDGMALADDDEGYRVLLTRLIEERAFREHWGETARNRILSRHAAAGWREALAGIYGLLAVAPARGCLVAADEMFVDDDLTRALINLYRSVPFSVRSLLRHYVGPRPYVSRLSITWRLRIFGTNLSLLNLVPSPADRWIHHLGRAMKRVWHLGRATLGRMRAATLRGSSRASDRDPIRAVAPAT